MKFKYKNILIFLSFSILYFTGLNSLKAQTINTKFGKNRVQYNNDFNNWWQYDTDNYSVFWYTNEFNLAKAVILLSQKSYNDIEDILDYKINKKIKIIVYSGISDFNQSNFGIKDEQFTNESGSSKVIDNKIIVYLDDDFTRLLNQIREGTATIFLNNMFSNLSFENVYSNLISSRVPAWFTMGAAAYLSNKWDMISDSQLRSFFLNKSKKPINFERLAEFMPKLAGKSFFNFIEKKYNNLSDLFYIERITRNLNKSVKNTTGKTLDSLLVEWKDYYNDIYLQENKNTSTQHFIKILSNTDDIIYTSFRFSSTNRYFAYSTDQYGKKNIYITNTKTHKTRKVFSSGYINKEQISDLKYPLFNFINSSGKLAIIYKKKGNSVLKIVNITDNKVIYSKPLPSKIKSVTGFDIWDKNNIYLTAIVNGNSDIFKYNLKKRTIKQITDDFWIEKDIKTTFFNDEKGLLFASNRLRSNTGRDYIDTILPTTKFDIFFLNMKTKKIKRLSSNKEANEVNPVIAGDKLYYTTDATGFTNIKQKDFNGKEDYITNNNFHIINFNSSQSKIVISDHNLCYNALNRIDLDNTSFYNPYLAYFKQRKNSIIELKKKNTEGLSFEIDNGLLFQSKFKDKEQIKGQKQTDIYKDKTVKKSLKKYIPSHAIASRLKFSFSEFTTRLDNQPLFDGQSIYTLAESDYTPPKTGILSKVLIKDMFEDYFIEAGVRLSPDFKEKEYFTVFDNLKHMIDWQYVYYRKTSTRYRYLRPAIIDKFKNTSDLFRVRAKYPFSVYKSISLAGNLRLDNNSIFASDTVSLNSPSNTEQRISLKLEYIFDNTSKIGTNLLEGNRSKAFIEVYNRFNFNPNSSNKIQLSTGFMTIVGYDMRQYFKILNHSILAFRAAGQTSFGSESNIYFLGGMENWQFSKYANTTQTIKNEKIAYKILAANLRGFGYNAKSGSSFSVFSSELRIPVFKYFWKSNSRFIKDFQVTFFLDAGLTWNGLSPFSKENTSNIKYIEVPPTIKIKLRYYSDPVIAGYGFGLRSTLFGYFVKLDYGWGIENRSSLRPILYFTLGEDF